MMKKRNIYNDGIKDVRSINDIEDIEKKQLKDFNILSKSDKKIQFEFGYDFWEFDRDSKTIKQYDDYVSMINDKGELVYDSQRKEGENKKYGTLLFQQLDNSVRIEELPDFNLKERKDFIIEPGRQIHGSIRIPANELKAKQEKVEEHTNNILEGISSEETKPIIDLIKTFVQASALNIFLFKRQLDNHRKENNIRRLVDNLDENLLDINEVIEDKEIFKKVPELNDVVQRYLKSKITDEAFGRDVAEILGNNNGKKLTKDISENENFIKNIYENFIKKVPVKISQDDEKIMKDYMKKQNITGFNLSKQLIEENQKEIFKKNPNITDKEYGIAQLFISSKLDGGVDKQLFSEKFGKLLVGVNEKNFKLDNVANIVKHVIDNSIDGLKHSLKKEQNKQTKI